jgi:formamidopyrimidine-DNA glycosylase
MPELPEVETVVRSIRPHLCGRVITGAWHDWPRVFGNDDPNIVTARLENRQIRGVDRRGKYILISLDQGVLSIHLRMTGRLYVAEKEAVHDADRWVHFRLELDDGRALRFSDSRKFGRVRLGDQVATAIPELGWEPFDPRFTAAVLAEALHNRQRPIKVMLLDQTIIAGIGNIYADESLHMAGIHPATPALQLGGAQIEGLYTAIQAVLAQAITHEGASINWYRKPDGSRGAAQDSLHVYGREGQPCHTCGWPIARTTIAQRGTHYCPRCQVPPTQ